MSDDDKPPASSLRDPFAPTSKPAPRAPPPPLRDFARVRRILLVGGGFVVALGIAAAAWKLWPRKGEALPMPAAELPAAVKGVHKRLVQTRSKGAQEADASHYAAACGGPDVFAFALHGDAFYAPEALAEIIHDDKRTRRALACGAAIERSVHGKPVYALHVEEPNRGSVDLMPLADGPPFGAGLRKHPPHGFSAMWCASDADGTCGEAPAMARLDRSDLWAVGSGADVEAFGEALGASEKRDAKETIAFGTLARAFDPYDVTTIGTSKEPFEFEPFQLLAEDSPDVVAAKRTFETKIADLGAHWATGGPFGEEGEIRLDVLASSDGDAKEILDALKDLRVAIRHGEELKYEIGSSATRAYREAYAAMERRAFVDAEPTVDGPSVHFVMKLVAGPKERDAFRAYVDELSKRNANAALLVTALTHGERPGDESLRAIGGVDLWRALERYDEHKPPIERAEPPEPVDVPELQGVTMPGGGEHSTANKQGAVYVFHRPGDAAAIANEAKRLLRAGSWDVSPTTFTSGATYRCTKEDRALTLSIRFSSGDLRLELEP